LPEYRVVPCLSADPVSDEFTSLTALTWVDELLEIEGPQILPEAPKILAAVLPSISHTKNTKIREKAR
jgi:hypothetical protein